MNAIMDWDEFLKTVTYKPGVTFAHEYDINHNQHFIWAKMVVEDTYHHGSKTSVRSKHPVPAFDRVGEEYAQNWIRIIVQQLEAHEADEWLRFDGELVFDPHRDEKVSSSLLERNGVFR